AHFTGRVVKCRVAIAARSDAPAEDLPVELARTRDITSGKLNVANLTVCNRRRHCYSLVLTFINTVAFGRRCIPPRGVARRSNTPGILPPRALRRGRGPQRGSRVGDPGRLAALGASPYL